MGKDLTRVVLRRLDGITAIMIIRRKMNVIPLTLSSPTGRKAKYINTSAKGVYLLRGSRVVSNNCMTHPYTLRKIV